MSKMLTIEATSLLAKTLVSTAQFLDELPLEEYRMTLDVVLEADPVNFPDSDKKDLAELKELQTKTRPNIIAMRSLIVAFIGVVQAYKKCEFAQDQTDANFASKQ